MDNVRKASVEWQGGMRFRGGVPGGPAISVDAGGVEGPGPMVALMVAAASCSGADIVSILEKMQVKLRKFGTEVTGVRAEDHPKRYRSLQFTFTLAAHELEQTKARRAIDLPLSQY